MAADLLKDDLGWALGVTLRRYLGVVHEIVSDVPGGPRGFQVISSAAQDLATSQVMMAGHLGIDRSVLTYLIDDLEAAGLVERRLDPADRRNRRIVATEAGRELWCERRAAIARAEDDMLSVLGGDRSTFKDLLQRVALAADRLDPASDACQAVNGLVDS